MTDARSAPRCASTGSAAALAVALAALACGSKPAAPEAWKEAGPPELRLWGFAEDFERPLAVFQHVFWEPRDTTTTREMLGELDLTGKRVLEIGTGSGLLSLCALKAGAASVVATDINPHAVENARFNAERFGYAERFEARLVSQGDSGAYAVLRPGERFDLILSNPPWEDDTPGRIEDFALYDLRWALLRSLLDGLTERLEPGGKVWLAYGTRQGVEAVLREAAARGMTARPLEYSNLDNLPDEFLPGLTLEVIP
jgi:release factor glutamine methyltransferase